MKNLIRKCFSVLFACVFVLTSFPLDSFSADKPNYYPNDTIMMEKVSDGTHKGKGTETFINSKNGFKVGDNTATDGVVASGDYVTYKFKISIAAGKARKRYFSVEQLGEGLDLTDFKNTNMSNSIIKTTFKDGQWELDIPRGAVGHIEGIFSLKAKDTQGEIVSGNVLTGHLKSNDGYDYKSKTDAVTVVSVPFADLTLDTNIYRYRSYNQDNEFGYFNIVPRVLKMEDYSDHGFVDSTKWHTDINVSEFPKETKWWIDNKEVIPEKGVIKNIYGTGRSEIKYQLPKDFMPKEGMLTKKYTIWIEPYEDSFKVGDSLNIKDIGSGENAGYDTSNFKIDGKSVNASSGYSNPNNNYASAFWGYEKHTRPPGYIYHWDLRYFVPRNYSKPLFEDENVYFNTKRSYYKQGSYSEYVYLDKFVTTDNDMYIDNYIEISDKGAATLDGSFVGAHFNDLQTNEYKDVIVAKKPITVVIDNKVVSPDKYKVEWRYSPEKSFSDKVKGATEWIESNQIPNSKSNQYRVVFNKDSADITKGHDIHVYTFLKADKNYDLNRDKGKMFHVWGAYGYKQKDDYNSIESVGRSKVLTFPTVPTLKADIEAGDAKFMEKDGNYKCTFKINDVASNISKSSGYNIKRVLDFNNLYDVDTFKLNNSNYKVEKTGKHQITITRNNFDITYHKTNDDWYADNLDFTIDSLYSLKGFDLDGTVKETVYLDYPAISSIKNGTLTSTDSDLFKLNGSKFAFSHLSSDFKQTEVLDNLDFTVKINALDKDFSQKIYLPFNGDAKKYMPVINKANKTDISINDETGEDDRDIMDGIGRSKIHGDYVIKEIKVENYSKDAVMEFEHNGVKEKLPINNGIVNIEKIKNTRLGSDESSLKISGSEGISDVQVSGAVVKIKLQPFDNRIDDAYVMWVDNERRINGEKIIETIAWPDYIKVVSSDISGYVWNDENKDYKRKNEKGYKDVSVELFEKKGDEWKSTGKVVKTDKDGFYEFTDLRHGTYKVKLKNITRRSGIDNEIFMINGKVDESGHDGELVLGEKNRFGVFERTKQTYSYNRYDIGSQDFADIELGYDAHKKEINFGFYVPVKNLALDKGVAKVTDLGDKAKVEWDVTVKNTGNETVKGAKLYDRMSSEVKGVRSKLGYEKVEIDEPERLIKVGGSQPLSGHDYGSYFVTNKGLYLVDRNGKEIKVNNIKGQVVSIAGDKPLSSNGSIVGTTEGVWLVDSDGSTIKVNDIEGQIVSISGNVPLSSNDGSIVGTTEGVWLVKRDGFTIKVNNIKGQVVSISGKYPLDSDCGSIVGTTEGVWLVKHNDSTIKVNDIKGQVVAISGDRPLDSRYGSIVCTTEGVWLVKSDGTTIKVNDIEGQVVSIVGNEPLNPFYGSIVGTTEGVWLVKSDGSTIKVDDINGQVVSISGYYPLGYNNGSIVVTTKGVWLVDKNGSTIKVNDIEGQVVSISGIYPLGHGGSIVGTTKGFWLVKNDGSTIKVNSIKGQVVSISGDTPLYSNRGSIVGTTEGVWLVKGDVAPIKVHEFETKDDKTLVIGHGDYGYLISKNNRLYLVDKNDKSINVKGVTGKVVSMSGDTPLYSYYGSIVGTTDGVWLIKNDGSTIKVNNIKGQVVSIAGEEPLSYGSIVGTTDGVWLVNLDGSTIKVNNIKGQVVSVAGEEPLSYTYGSIVGTTEGAWLVKPDGSTIKVNNIVGKVVSISGKSPLDFRGGSIVGTTERAWLVKPNGSTIKVNNIVGKVVSVSGENPLDSKYGSIVETTDGVWLVNPDGSTIKVNDIKGNVVSVSGIKPLDSRYGGSIVETTEGVWVVKGDGSTIKVNDIEGQVVSISGYAPLDDGAIVGTTDGVWLVKDDGSTIKVDSVKGQVLSVSGDRPLDSDYFSLVFTDTASYFVKYDKEKNKAIVTKAKIPNINPYEKRTFVEDANVTPINTTDLDNFVSREFLLPDIPTDSSVTLHIEGIITKDKVDKVVANQSFTTSETTPRSGITTTPVTGYKQEKGVPDLPVVPKPEILDPYGIEVRTSTVNYNIDDDIEKDDLSDQNGAIIPKSDNPDIAFGNLNGYAWYDLNNNGLRDDNSPASNITVSIFDEDENLIDEVKTDKNGYWEVKHIPKGNYTVHYDILGHKHNEKIWTVTDYHKGGNEKLDSDVDVSGYVKNPVATVDNTNPMGTADCGLISIDASIHIQKGPENDVVTGNLSLTDELNFEENNANSSISVNNRLDDTDNDPRTNSYQYKIVNNSNNNLTDIKLSDKTISGNDAKRLDSYILLDNEGNQVSDKITYSDMFNDGSDSLILKPGYSIVGALGTSFTDKKDVHEDELTVTATVLYNNSKITNVTSSDKLKTVYKYVPDRTLVINKCGGTVDDNKPLENVSFKLERVLDKDKNTYKSLGTYVTDEEGKIDLKLPEGLYRITETKGKFGYLKPEGDGWFVDLSYNKDGKIVTSVSADSTMPYSEIKKTNNDTWGDLYLYNYNVISIPLTGGNRLWFFVGGFILVIFGLIKIRKIRKVDN